ncbi:hypothetical protein AAW00_12235 [Aurantiacibacter luteus]|uniref:Uncharacterized protein n=1 Tax=Aurantiacibacter luteus TaxID=1581420 RepID=A0A0G9MSZ8_9SPHN|nr:hypothetical protein AAW00_12235 [Aurantiacibacter luteus]
MKRRYGSSRSDRRAGSMVVAIDTASSSRPRMARAKARVRKAARSCRCRSGKSVVSDAAASPEMA